MSLKPSQLGAATEAVSEEAMPMPPSPKRIPATQRRAYSVAVYPRHRGEALPILHRRLGVWLPPGGECLPGETPAKPPSASF